jgi:tyrosine-protein kinase
VSQQGAVAPYLRAVAAHPLLVAIVVLLALLGAAGWVAHRRPHYKASADILFNPLPSNNEGANGLPLLRESGEAGRLSQTAVALLNTHQAAAAAAARLGRGWSASRVARAVNVQPQGESDIISITAEADSASGAKRLANTYALATLAVREAQLRHEARRLLPAVSTRPAAPNELLAQERQSLLLALSNGQDPNFSLSQTASRPASPTDTSAVVVMVLALVAGFAIASVAAVLTELVSDRVRTSEELLDMSGLPALAYVPPLPRGYRPSSSAADRNSGAPAAVHEAFRMIRVQLDAPGEGMHGGVDGGRTILLTSASSGDGKTTSVVALGAALAEAGHRVVLVDLDLRKPDLCRATGLANRLGVTSLLMNGKELQSVLMPTELPGVTVLAAGPGASAQLLQPVVSQLSRLLEQICQTADYVIIDTPPLGEVADAYQLLPFADEIVLVARPDNTRRSSLRFMRDLLARANRTPRGVIIVGQRVRNLGYYHYGQAHADQGRLRRWLHRAPVAQG